MLSENVSKALPVVGVPLKVAGRNTMSRGAVSGATQTGARIHAGPAEIHTEKAPQMTEKLPVGLHGLQTRPLGCFDGSVSAPVE